MIVVPITFLDTVTTDSIGLSSIIDGSSVTSFSLVASETVQFSFGEYFYIHSVTIEGSYPPGAVDITNVQVYLVDFNGTGNYSFLLVIIKLIRRSNSI